VELIWGKPEKMLQVMEEKMIHGLNFFELLEVPP
jgi:hypothetical protein